MSELLKNEREIVVPGEEIVKSMEFVPGRNCFREGETIMAKKVGLVSVDHRVISVVPLNSPYIPREGDMVIGEVVSIQNNGWVVLIDAPHDAFLPLAGVREYIDPRKVPLSKFYSVGDIIYAKVSATQGRSIYLSMQDIKAKKFRGGRIVKINPAKVPRLIGKKGSMISLIKERTGCRIHVGQNGKVWLEGQDAESCIKAFGVIEKESASEGLTEKIGKLLGGAVKKEPITDEALKEPEKEEAKV
ncbi:MAG: KH domain-containing protein [Candidatus Aenigmarchaeota archaeon]|nr:KH domain-containing protein [Candidatus Aenigmarchaeota archaeon]